MGNEYLQIQTDTKNKAVSVGHALKAVPPFPGTNFGVGASGPNVLLVQQAINKIAPDHPGRLWIIAETGVFGNMTRDAVFSFQSIFGLPITGVVNMATWDKLMWEAYGDRPAPPEIPPFPGTDISSGATGPHVLHVQRAINILAEVHPELWKILDNGIFGHETENAVAAFQLLFGLPATGVVNRTTWDRLMWEAHGVTPPEIPPFPGANLSVGATGPNVLLVQKAINIIAPNYPGRLWILREDGIFGNMTRDAIFAFQSIFGLPITGVVNQATWDRLMWEAHGVKPEIPPFPGTNLSVLASDPNVLLVQRAINRIAPNHPGRLWIITEDGIFGHVTRDAVFTFQSIFGLPITGVVNRATWDRLMREAAGTGRNCGLGLMLRDSGIIGNICAGKPIDQMMFCLIMLGLLV